MDEKREMLRHAVATVAYRGAKAVRGAPEGFAAFRPGGGARAAVEILAHVGDLFEWALALAKGAQVWRDSPPLPWSEEIDRFFLTLARFDAYLASDAALGFQAEQLFQGPIADALTHVGQLTVMRRLAGSPIRGENYFKADITSGRVSAEQAAPRREFD